LHHAVIAGNLRVVEDLIALGANVNATNNDQEAPMHYAALKGYLKILRILIEKEANIDIRDNIGMTPFMLATMRGHNEVAKEILKYKPDISIKSSLGNTAINIASSSHNKEILSLLDENYHEEIIQQAGKILTAIAASIINGKEDWKFLEWVIDEIIGNDGQIDSESISIAKAILREKDWSYEAHLVQVLKRIHHNTTILNKKC